MSDNPGKLNAKSTHKRARRSIIINYHQKDATTKPGCKNIHPQYTACREVHSKSPSVKYPHYAPERTMTLPTLVPDGLPCSQRHTANSSPVTPLFPKESGAESAPPHHSPDRVAHQTTYHNEILLRASSLQSRDDLMIR